MFMPSVARAGMAAMHKAAIGLNLKILHEEHIMVSFFLLN
jgi:hypothetical protein